MEPIKYILEKIFLHFLLIFVYIFFSHLHKNISKEALHLLQNEKKKSVEEKKFYTISQKASLTKSTLKSI